MPSNAKRWLLPPPVTDLDIFVGQTYEKISRREDDWIFHPGCVGGISSGACPWRIIAAGRIAFADTDDGQIFWLTKGYRRREKINHPFVREECCLGRCFSNFGGIFEFILRAGRFLRFLIILSGSRDGTLSLESGQRVPTSWHWLAENWPFTRMTTSHSHWVC